MKCPYAETIVREGESAVPPEHVLTCATCAARIERLTRARDVLRRDVRAPDMYFERRLAAQVQQHAGIDPWVPRIRYTYVALGIIVTTLLVGRIGFAPKEDRPTAPSAPSAPWTVAPKQTVQWGAVTVAGVRPSQMEATGTRQVRLTAGAVEVRREPTARPTPWTLLTPGAKIELREQARVVVDVSNAQTRVAVELGRVRITPRRNTNAARWLTVGQRWSDGSPTVPGPPAAPTVPGPPAAPTVPGPPAAPTGASVTETVDRPSPRPPKRAAPATSARRQRQIDRVAEADRWRHQGRAERALQIYRAVVEDPDAHPYDAEYAAFQAATIQADQGRASDALRSLAHPRLDRQRGALAPERTRLAVELYLAEGEVERAAALVEVAPPHEDEPPFIEARIRVARALADMSISRAERLLTRAMKRSTEPSLIRLFEDTQTYIQKKNDETSN